MNNARNIAFWVVLFLLILALFNLISGGQSTMATSTVSYSDFVDRVESGDVTTATIDGEQITFRGGDGRDYVAIRPEGADTTDLLVENDIDFSARPQEQSGFMTVLMTFLPFLILIEWGVLFIPILLHGLLGVWFALSGKNNIAAYGYGGNWRYTVQRVSGYVGVVFIFMHITSLRFGQDVPLFTYGGLMPVFDPSHAASSTAIHFQDGAWGFFVTVLYLVCVLALVFHLANGIWTAALTWGLRTFLRLLAPFLPFVTEHLWGSLGGDGMLIRAMLKSTSTSMARAKVVASSGGRGGGLQAPALLAFSKRLRLRGAGFFERAFSQQASSHINVARLPPGFKASRAPQWISARASSSAGFTRSRTSRTLRYRPCRRSATIRVWSSADSPLIDSRPVRIALSAPVQRTSLRLMLGGKIASPMRRASET